MSDDDKKQASGAPSIGSPSTATAAGPQPDPHEGPGKGKAFFDRAKTVAATGNFDYAIDMYIEGLTREPFNVEEHKALREVGMRRKIAGGKAGGGLLGMGGAKLPKKGKTPKDAMLNSEFTLARDVGNISAMLSMIRNADLLELKELVLWLGQLLKEANRTSKSPRMEIYQELATIYAKNDEYARACEAIHAASELKPTDMELIQLANEYAAKETIKKGNYEKGQSFKESIKDTEGTKKLLEEENLGKSEEYRKKMLESAKADYEANPMELQVINKYAKALEEMEDEEHENLAMELLSGAFQETKIYRLKMHQATIRMKQYRRNLRIMKDAIKADPKDKEMLRQYEALNKERLSYELHEFMERAEHMPTDLVVKYELGARLWESKRIDEAIVVFQEAQNHPKHRVDALHLLGRSFLLQGMKPEAVETLKRSIDEYDLATTGDKKSRELHYWFARALEENKQTREAVDMYSKVVQWDIGYADARKRMNELRTQLGN